MQRDHYLPLKVIVSTLTPWSAARPSSCRCWAVRGTGTPVRSPSSRGPRRRVSGAAGCWRLQASTSGRLVEWESYGLLAPVEDGMYDAESVTVAGLIAELGAGSDRVRVI
ncbi:hypothetical protein GCM10023238_24850 [Streptomyces heliomycini]